MPQVVPLASQSERVERLRAQLAGESAPASDTTSEGSAPSPRARRAARSARRLALSPAANLLYGMTLRAAARSEQSEKLTDLEEQLLGVLRVTGAADAEIAEFGRVFQEQAKGRGASTLFTSEVTERPLSEGFSFDDLAAVLPALAPEITAQPNFRTVRVDALEPGQPLDTAEAAAARNEYGAGVIVFLAEDGLKGRGYVVAPLDARVEYSKFYAEARAHDSVFDPANEIYWCSGAGSEVSKSDYMSGVFGGIDTGHWRYFGDGAHFFNGKIKRALTGNIQCWEEDDSNSQFYNDLRGAMRSIKEWAFTTSEKLENQSGDYEASSAFLSLVGLIAALVDAILGWVRNDDDLIQDVSVAFSATALHTMSKRSVDLNSIRFVGDGGGRYILYLNVVMPHGPGFKVDHRYLDDATWKQALSTNFPVSNSPVAVASHAGGLHALWLRDGSSAPVHATNLNPTTRPWGPPAVPWANATSIYAPALASDGTNLHAVHVAADNSLRYSWHAGTSWSAPTPINGGGPKAFAAPALAYHEGKLHLLIVGFDRNLWHLVYDGAWSPAVRLMFEYALPAFTEHAPGVASHRGALNVIYRESTLEPGSVKRLTLQDGQWTRQDTNAGWRIRTGPAIATLGTRLYCLLPGLDGSLWWTYLLLDKFWSDTTRIDTPNVDEPALTTHDGKLHLLYRGR
ncbi:hypothetical protein [Streptomyces sp. NPDC060031]|uniref:hypothetical protein n=1 Tax=Streptomyces sp. NPDC060031 TaxID=3347043 RepID=UPI003689A0EC